MCGICGFINPPNIKVSLTTLKQMSQTISHRGPDDRGEVILKNVALANRRLAILDLSAAGHMPMSNPQKTIWITYNGEIYNYPQLKQELIEKGYHFRSHADTEAILYLYDAYGVEAFAKLVGMFAISIWDVRKKELVLARDHFGIKPLHYYLKDGLFIFGSEIKAILAHPRVKKVLNFESFSTYFSIGFGAIPSPYTIFKDIHKLPPAHYAVYKNNQLFVKKYWHLDQIKPSLLSFSEAKENLMKLLSESVRSQLISDVPLGAFLSGGIDSSTIVALMKNYHSGEIKTFSIGFKEQVFDESKYSSLVAKILGTHHEVKNFEAKQLVETLPKVIDKLDEPLADASILPTYLLSQFTRQYVTVALSGDGGDELFAGYPTYIAHKFSRLVSYLPTSLLKTLLPTFEKIERYIPILKHSPNLSTKFKLKRFIEGINKELSIQYLNFMGPINFTQKNLLFSQQTNELLDNIDPAKTFIDNLLNEVKNFDKQKQLQYLDLKTYLAEDCLVKTDRASSFNSLEVRVPFLTPQIAEFAFSLPGSYHFRGLILKRLFKAVAKDLLSLEIVNRPKKGFGVPIHLWLRHELNPLLKKLLSKKYLLKQGLFDDQFIGQLIETHQNQMEDHRMVLWNLLIFQLWYEKWFS